MSVKFNSLKDGLKRARKEKGLTQMDFSKMFKIDNTPVSITTVRNWEQGRTYPEAKTLEALCDFYQCDMDYLFGRIDCKTHDTQFISDYTGLSEEAIDKLKELRKNGQLISVLNHLVCNKSVLEKMTIYYASRFELLARKYPYNSFGGHPAQIDERLFYADILNVLPVDRETFYNENIANHKIAEQMVFTLVDQRINDNDFMALLQFLHNDMVKNGLATLEDKYYAAVAEFGKFRGYGEYLETVYGIALEKYNDRPKEDENIDTDPIEDDGLPF